jgi:3-keto-disaccharide hydrolase
MRVHGETESDRRSGGVVFATAVLAVALVAVSLVGSVGAQDDEEIPPVVHSGGPGQAPADAIVLFGGDDASAFRHLDGAAVKWSVADGALTIKPGSGGIRSVAEFRAAQLHLEFASPAPAKGSGQGRGNSGVYLQGRYEVQILDSYENDTYPNGQCGAVYGQYPPLVNVCRPPGEWQSYDLIFHPPIFDEEGQKVENGTLTVLHNGVLIQDHVEILGSTTAAPLGEGPEPGPLWLQDHHNPVRYRNIWIRPL